jgi:hypothetical protein
MNNYDSESWTIRKTEIMNELQIPHITKFVKYRGNWKEHVNRMNSDRTPKKILKYQS